MFAKMVIFRTDTHSWTLNFLYFCLSLTDINLCVRVIGAVRTQGWRAIRPRGSTVSLLAWSAVRASEREKSPPSVSEHQRRPRVAARTRQFLPSCGTYIYSFGLGSKLLLFLFLCSNQLAENIKLFLIHFAPALFCFAKEKKTAERRRKRERVTSPDFVCADFIVVVSIFFSLHFWEKKSSERREKEGGLDPFFARATPDILL